MSYSPIVVGSGLAGYAFVARTRETQQDLLARSPQIARNTEIAMTRLEDIQTSDQLMEDRALLSVVLGSFGLEADLDSRAFIKRILDSDLGDSRSLANRLADKRYLALAQSFNFAGEGGPQLNGARSGDEIARSLAAIQTADDLLRDRSLLRATLTTLGLERDLNNTYFLKQVLESDPADPASFARSLSDPRYTELAEAFGLADKTDAPDTIYGIAKLFADTAADLAKPKDLLDDTERLVAVLDIFGLRGDADRTGFLTAVLASDPSDPASFANRQDDPRYTALAKVFDFAARAQAEAEDRPFQSTLETFVATVTSRQDRIETTADLTTDFSLMLATFEFFDLPPRADGVDFVTRLLDSDRDSPTSLINVFPDTRYRVFADALNLKEAETERTYPKGFAEAIVEKYLDRQFEIEIGNSDPAMRIALSLERDLNQVVDAGLSNDSRWFGIMASNPLRAAFDTVLLLPKSVGALDIDRQLGIYKERAERFFGTSEVADFLDPERLDTLRRRYLIQDEVTALTTVPQGSSIVQTLLSSALR